MFLGVVIQGPVLSYGGGPKQVSEGFDTSEYVRRNIDRIKAMFPNNAIIVRSHWSDEDIGDLDVDCIASPAENSWSYKNIFKQKMTSLNGVQFLIDRGVTHILKLRSDQLLPESIYRQLEALSSLDVIHVSELYKNDAPAVGDFYYFGPASVVRLFCLSMPGPFLSNRLSFNNQRSILLTYLWTKSGLSLRQIISRCMIRHDVTFLNKHIMSFSETDFWGVSWRGSSMNEIFAVNDNPFCWQVDETNQIDLLDRFISVLIDIRSFFNSFCKNMYRTMKSNISIFYK